MKKIIGIDIDGVLTCEEKGNSNIWEIKLAEYLKKDINRCHDVYNFKDAFNITSDELDGFIKKHLYDIYETLQPASGAINVLSKLNKLNFKIYLITARDEKYRNVTENWLSKYHIPYDLLYHEDNKAPLAVKKNISLFIEDNKNNTLELLKNNIPVILVNKYHNKNLQKRNNIFRVDNWQEIENIIFDFYDITDQQSVI